MYLLMIAVGVNTKNHIITRTVKRTALFHKETHFNHNFFIFFKFILLSFMSFFKVQDDLYILLLKTIKNKPLKSS